MDQAVRYNRYLLDQLIRWGKGKRRILDFGAGNGRFAIALHEAGYEIHAIEAGTLDKADNPLKNAPHTAAQVTANDWKHPYPRETAAYPSPWTRQHKFWPPVGKIDAPYGDRNLVCACPPIEDYSDS